MPFARGAARALGPTRFVRRAARALGHMRFVRRPRTVGSTASARRRTPGPMPLTRRRRSGRRPKARHEGHGDREHRQQRGGGRQREPAGRGEPVGRLQQPAHAFRDMSRTRPRPACTPPRPPAEPTRRPVRAPPAGRTPHSASWTAHSTARSRPPRTATPTGRPPVRGRAGRPGRPAGGDHGGQRAQQQDRGGRHEQHPMSAARPECGCSRPSDAGRLRRRVDHIASSIASMPIPMDSRHARTTSGRSLQATADVPVPAAGSSLTPETRT